MTKVILRTISGVLLSMLVSCGCSSRDGLPIKVDNEMRKMETSEQRANKNASNKLVAFMSFDTLFSSLKLRSLARAAGKGNVSEIRSLVEQGAEVNEQGNRGAIALFWAMREGSVSEFRVLLELGADPNIVFEDGGTVMHWAVRNRNPAYLELALQHGGNPNLRSGQFDKTPIFEALGERRDRLDLLLNAGADINARSGLGTPVFVAARRGSFDVVYKLLEYGADYQNESATSQTLLEIALEKKPMMDPSHELHQWLERVITWLESEGS